MHEKNIYFHRQKKIYIFIDRKISDMFLLYKKYYLIRKYYISFHTMQRKHFY